MATRSITQNNMSVAQSGVSFNHSCLKVPVDPTSKRPLPQYERDFNSKLSHNDPQEERRKIREASAGSSTISGSEKNYKSVESYLQFYEAIPDYSELHHLSDDEFYSRLRSLKITQKRFCEGAEDCADDVEGLFDSGNGPSSNSGIGTGVKYNPEDVYGKKQSPKTTFKKTVEGSLRTSSGYSNSSSGKRQVTLLDAALRPNGYAKKMRSWCNGISESKKKSSAKVSDSENASDIDDKTLPADWCCKTYLSKNKLHWAGCEKNGCADDDCLSDDGICSRRSKSLPNSPAWKPKMYGYRIPDLCGCCCGEALRNKELNLYHSTYGEGVDSYCVRKRNAPKMKWSRPVPLLSRIPLYEKLMAKQEERRRMNHTRYSRELRASVQPFSFTKREEEAKQKSRISCSNPELTAFQSHSKGGFKAKPIPKYLFSSYAYDRMREEDFYRALKKRIRAEEMLKASSLPPSMAAREKDRRCKSLEFLDGKHCKKGGGNRFRGYKRACEVLRKEIEFDENRSAKGQKRRGKPVWSSNKTSTDSSTEASPYESVSEPEMRHQKRPHSAISINKSNLASVLRLQTVRKRIEKEMADSLEQNRIRQQTKLKERLIRMTPAWRALNYSTKEDLALRVAARKEEERLKRKHYEKLMRSIYGRVHQMPPLFQRQSSNQPTRGNRSEKEAKLKNYEYQEPSYEEKSGTSTKSEQAGDKGRGPSPRSSVYGTRFRKCSDSSESHEKSEEAKMEESDGETAAHSVRTDDFEPPQAKEGKNSAMEK